MSEHEVVEAVPVAIAGALATIPEREDFRGYQGVATVALNADQLAELEKAMPAEAYDILPTGEVYVSQVHYRRKLNASFGPGSWALVPRGPYNMQGNTVCREYALVGPGGRFISEAIGEAEYQPTNDRMTYASACEAVKSNALTRCCKDLGIASECWDRRFCDQWKANNAVAVWRKNSRNRKPEWRRRDAPKFYDEQGETGQQERPTAQAERGQATADEQPQKPPSQTPACGHCGSINVKQDPAAPEWSVCADCHKGTKRI